MKDRIFDISFEDNGKKYTGWVNPSSEENDQGHPVSYHVVLDKVSFGHLSFSDCKWSISEDRPQHLVKAVGKEIEKRYRL